MKPKHRPGDPGYSATNCLFHRKGALLGPFGFWETCHDQDDQSP